MAEKKLLIKQTRSIIGCKQDQRATARCLGLRGIGSSVTKASSPSLLGMLAKIDFLVEVKEA